MSIISGSTRNIVQELRVLNRREKRRKRTKSLERRLNELDLKASQEEYRLVSYIRKRLIKYEKRAPAGVG